VRQPRFRWYVPRLRLARQELDLRLHADPLAAAYFDHLPAVQMVVVLPHCLRLSLDGEVTRGQLSAAGRQYSQHEPFHPYMVPGGYHQTADGECGGFHHLLDHFPAIYIARHWAELAGDGMAEWYACDEQGALYQFAPRVLPAPPVPPRRRRA
jgi:hypothetical protein